MGKKPGLAGPLGRGVGTSRPEVCPAGPSQHLAPLVQTRTPSHPVLLPGHPPRPCPPGPADPPSMFQELRLVAGRERGSPVDPCHHPPPSPQCSTRTAKPKWSGKGPHTLPACARCEVWKLRPVHVMLSPQGGTTNPKGTWARAKSGQRGQGRGAACPHSRPLRQGSTPLPSAAGTA